MKLDVLNLDGKATGSVDLNDAVFGLTARKDLLHRVVNWQLAKARGGHASTQTRSEVSRTGAKPFRQKGTGNARHGSKRSNIFVGGSVAFGPKPRDFSFSLTKKVRKLALKTALSAKAESKDLIIIDEAALKTHKTKDLASKLANMNASNATFIVDSIDANFDKASRNLPFIKVLPTEGANVYDILHQNKLVLTKAAAQMLEQRLLNDDKPAAVAKPAKKASAKPAAKKAPAKKAAPAKETAAAKPAAKKAPAKKAAAKKED